MADIKQAAKWMKEGKKVRRKVWADWYPSWVMQDGEVRMDGVVDDPVLAISSLLADDWEIAE